MAAHCSAKVAAILGGAIRNQTDEALFHGIMKSTTTWRLRFAATLASPIQSSSKPCAQAGLRKSAQPFSSTFCVKGSQHDEYRNMHERNEAHRYTILQEQWF